MHTNPFVRYEESYNIFRPSKRPTSGKSKELTREDTQLKYIWYGRDLLLTVYNKYIFSQYRVREYVKRRR